MRSFLLLCLLSLTACSPSANIDPVEQTEEPDADDFNRVHTQLRAVDQTLAALRSRLEVAEVDHDVVVQAMRVREQAFDSLQARVWAMGSRMDEAEATADLALIVAVETSEAADEAEARLSSLEEETADAQTRIAAMDSAPVGLRAIDIDGAVCGLTAPGSGVIYRVATSIRPDQLLLLAGEDGALRVQVPAAVVCGVTSADEFSPAPNAVTDGADVYVLDPSAGWFHVGA